MARYIDAEELELEYYGLSIHGTMAVKSVLPIFTDLLEKQPTADVEEVKWIDVNKRLPESTIEHGILIFVQKQGCKPYITLGYYWNDKFMNDDMFQEDCVTHWQSLPEPPKEQ